MVDNSIKSYTLKLLIKLTKVKNFKFDELFLDNKKIDSLNLLNIYSLLEKKYNIKFKSSELGKLNSIDNIYKIINKKIK